MEKPDKTFDLSFMRDDNPIKLEVIKRRVPLRHEFLKGIDAKNYVVAINQMIDLAIPGADLILMGVSEEKVQINTRVVLDKGLSLKGVTRSNKQDFEFVAKMLNNQEVVKDLSIMVLSKNKINSVNDIYKCFEEDINNKTLIGKNLMYW